MKKHIRFLLPFLLLASCSGPNKDTTFTKETDTANTSEKASEKENNIFNAVHLSLRNVFDGIIKEAEFMVDGKKISSSFSGDSFALKDIRKNSMLEISHPKYETKKVLVNDSDLDVISMEYPYVDIGKTRYSSSPLYNDWTLSSTRTLSTIRFRFTSPYNRFLNSKSALSLYINAKESKEIKSDNDYEFKMTADHLFVYDYGFIHSGIDLSQFSYTKETDDESTVLYLDVPYFFLGIDAKSIIGVSMVDNLFEKNITTELCFDEETIDSSSPREYVRIDWTNRSFKNDKNEDNPYWISKAQYASLINGKDYSFASKKYCNHKEDCDDVHFSLDYTEEKISFDFVGFGEFKKSEYFQIVLHNNIIDKNAWQLCMDDVILQINQDKISIYSECEEFFSVQNSRGTLLKSIPLNSFIDYGPYFTLKADIDISDIPNIHTAYDDIYIMAVEFDGKTLYDGVDYAENFFYQGKTLGDPADLANYACIDAPKRRISTLNQTQRLAVIGDRNISFANPDDTKMTKADDVYLKTIRNDKSLTLDMVGFGDFSDTEIVTFVFHMTEENGEEWKIQKEDVTLMVSKKKAKIVTGTTDFWVGTRITRGTECSSSVNYTRYDDYFSLSIDVDYQEISTLLTSTSKIRMYAFEFGFGGVLYNNDPWTKLMRKNGVACGDPAFQRNYIEI